MTSKCPALGLVLGTAAAYREASSSHGRWACEWHVQ